VSGGALVLVATPIGNLGDLSPRAAATLAEADVIACEDTRRTRHLLTAAGITPRSLIAVHEHNEASAVPGILERVKGGQRVALVTDAGTPGISDPGQRVVRAVAAAGLAVEVVPGPTAAVAALVISGLDTDRWCFEGFLPRRAGERGRRLADLAGEARTLVFYEAPSRVDATLAALAGAFGAERRVAVARELTKMFEETWRGTLGEAVSLADNTATAARAAAAADAADAAGVPTRRGEYVIVVEGATDRTFTDEDVTARLVQHLEAGDDRKGAVAAVAAELRLPRRRVYDLALRLRRGP
jgi:16S rRNA (cytidine1402-2'-O)-methyltransferase